MREFLWSDDMADACVFLMENIDFKDIVKGISGKGQGISGNKTYPLPLTPLTPHFLNIGTGKDISIKDLVYLIKDIIGYNGDFYFSTSKPDGTMRKVTDISKLHSLGWKHKVEHEEGIKKVYEWYKR